MQLEMHREPDLDFVPWWRENRVAPAGPKRRPVEAVLALERARQAGVDAITEKNRILARLDRARERGEPTAALEALSLALATKAEHAKNTCREIEEEVGRWQRSNFIKSFPPHLRLYAERLWERQWARRAELHTQRFELGLGRALGESVRLEFELARAVATEDREATDRAVWRMRDLDARTRSLFEAQRSIDDQLHEVEDWFERATEDSSNRR